MSRRPVPLDASAREAWDAAQALWGVHMHDPLLEPGAGRAQGAPAWFAFPPEITVDPVMVERLGAAAELESVFAHELGHHVLAPSTRIDALTIRHQLARALAVSSVGDTASAAQRGEQLGMLGNLWNDLLVNTGVALRQRRRDRAVGDTREPGIVRASRAIYAASHDTRDRLWWVYLRAYELLWNLPAGALCAIDPPPAPPPSAPRSGAAAQDLSRIPERYRRLEQKLREAQEEALRVATELRTLTRTRPEVDAVRLADLVRTFAADPVSGALRFGLLAWPYLLDEGDGRDGGSLPGGACASDDAPATASELGRVLADPRVRAPLPIGVPGEDQDPGDRGAGQSLGLAETLALYEGSDADAVVAAWYRSEAAPWVRPYRERRPAAAAPDLPGPAELWDAGDDLAALDWSQTLQVSPDVIPGVTTRRRSYLEDEPAVTEAAVELDVYLDSSGSMPRPSTGSPAVLAGMIVALSVLRGGGRVRVTSFSGPGQVAGTDRFTRDLTDVVAGLTTFFAGATVFPLDLFRDRDAAARRRPDAVRHLLVLSDDGLVSMFGRGNEPFEHVAAAARPRFRTATLVLQDPRRQVAPLAAAAGYDVVYLDEMSDAPAACAVVARAIQEAGTR